MSTQTITLGGGCFWCLETAFNTVEGVISAYSAYSNGHVDQPSYEAVCSGTTGHAEVVQVTFDDEILSLREVLEIFFALHDPTQLNRQGNDTGTQYRSGIYFHNDEQKRAAQHIIKEIEDTGIWPNPVVTEVLPLNNYFQAEDYHQDYFANNPENMYCNMVVAPKLAKFKKTFISKLKTALQTARARFLSGQIINQPPNFLFLSLREKLTIPFFSYKTLHTNQTKRLQFPY